VRFAFYGRVSTEDWQDPVTSRARQLAQATMLAAGNGTIVWAGDLILCQRVLPPVTGAGPPHALRPPHRSLPAGASAVQEALVGRSARHARVLDRSAAVGPACGTGRCVNSGPMICRLWRGWTTKDNADAYERIVRGQVIPGIEARRIPGFRSIDLVRR